MFRGSTSVDREAECHGERPLCCMTEGWLGGIYGGGRKEMANLVLGSLAPHENLCSRDVKEGETLQTVVGL